MSETPEPLIYPEQLTPALAQILGLPNFRMYGLWMALREAGVEIEHRYEAEMAAAIHFLVPFALRHGDDWQAHAATKLKAMKAAHLASKVEPS